MRGSPLIRTFLVLLVLTAAGFGLNLLGNKKSILQPVGRTESATDSEVIETRFVLTLSAEASKISIESNGQTHPFDPSSQSITGDLTLGIGHPTLFLDIEWKDQTPSPRFAKLVLEPDGVPTMTKVFDSEGDLSDVWEIHLHHDEHE